jgi:pyrroloquinoline quinone (PQQ) biosynthesis protein C
MKKLSSVESLRSMQKRVEPLQQRLAAHPLYLSIRNLQQVRIFMESHVFAVWDFMTLLKSLQRSLTCVELPWTPTALPSSRRFINEIVLGEESDEYEGRSVSHFEIYLEAMEELGAETRRVRAVVETPSRGISGICLDEAPAAARDFVQATFDIVCNRPVAAQAAAFAFGREDVIPAMFTSLIQQLNRDLKGRAGKFVWYLERHIQVDGENHGPLALGMVTDLCGDDATLWQQASDAAEDALLARLKLWDGVLAAVRSDRDATYTRPEELYAAK